MILVMFHLRDRVAIITGAGRVIDIDGGVRKANLNMRIADL